MEKDILNYLPTVMFCETPCTLCASVHSHGFLALVVPNHQVIHIVQGSMQPPVSCPRDWLGLYGWFWRGSWICCCVMWSSLQFGQIFCCCLSQTGMSLGRILYPDLSWDSVHLFFLDSNFSYLLTSGLWLRTLLCCSIFFQRHILRVCILCWPHLRCGRPSQEPTYNPSITTWISSWHLISFTFFYITQKVLV